MVYMLSPFASALSSRHDSGVGTARSAVASSNLVFTISRLLNQQLPRINKGISSLSQDLRCMITNPWELYPGRARGFYHNDEALFPQYLQ